MRCGTYFCSANLRQNVKSALQNEVQLRIITPLSRNIFFLEMSHMGAVVFCCLKQDYYSITS